MRAALRGVRPAGAASSAHSHACCDSHSGWHAATVGLGGSICGGGAGTAVARLAASVRGAGDGATPRRGIASGTTNGVRWYNASIASSARCLPGDWTVVPLGTVSAMPNRTRNVSATLLRASGFSYLFDAGEGTQSQITACFASSLRSIRRVFITHNHGDHIFGLPAVVSYVVQAQRAHESAGVAPAPRLQIYGPVGIHQFIRAALASLGRIGLERLPIDVTELALPGHRLPPPEVVARTVCGKHSYAYPNADGVYDLVDETDHVVQAAPLRHTAPCVGYSITEKQRRHLVPERLIERGIMPGKLYSHIVEGREVIAPDGSRVLYEDVSIMGAPSRRVVVLGDNCDASAMLPIAEGADIVVHEATLRGSERHKAMARGHSTAAMAGEFAARCKARRLLLTHFSPAFSFHPTDASIHHLGVKEVKEALAAYHAHPARRGGAASAAAAAAVGAAGAAGAISAHPPRKRPRQTAAPSLDVETAEGTPPLAAGAIILGGDGFGVADDGADAGGRRDDTPRGSRHDSAARPARSAYAARSSSPSPPPASHRATTAVGTATARSVHTLAPTLVLAEPAASHGSDSRVAGAAAARGPRDTSRPRNGSGGRAANAGGTVDVDDDVVAALSLADAGAFSLDSPFADSAGGQPGAGLSAPADLEYTGYVSTFGGVVGGLHPIELAVLETMREEPVPVGAPAATAAKRAGGGGGGAANAAAPPATVTVTRTLQENAAEIALLKSAGGAALWQPIRLSEFSYPVVSESTMMMMVTREAQAAFGRGEVLCARDFMAIPIPTSPAGAPSHTIRFGAREGASTPMVVGRRAAQHGGEVAATDRAASRLR